MSENVKQLKIIGYYLQPDFYIRPDKLLIEPQHNDAYRHLFKFAPGAQSFGRYSYIVPLEQWYPLIKSMDDAGWTFVVNYTF